MEELKLNDDDFRELRILLRVSIESIDDIIRSLSLKSPLKSPLKSLDFLQDERDRYSRLLDKIVLISLG